REYFSNMMVELGEADACISGLSVKYPVAIKPILQVIGTAPNTKMIAGMYILLTKRGPMFVADTTINESPTAQEIVQITLNTAEAVKRANLVPRVALLSYSNFGSHHGEVPKRMQEATAILRQSHPELIV